MDVEHGALKVEELHICGERLHFRRITGSGPEALANRWIQFCSA